LLLTTGRILSQYNVGAQTRRTGNVIWHDEDVLEIHPHDAELRGIKEGNWVRLSSRSGETTLRAKLSDRINPGVVYTTFHHPETQANVITTDYSDWATNCPPTAPLAPARFSTMTVWPSFSCSLPVVTRAIPSVAPPGVKGTMTRIGPRPGQAGWAWTEGAASSRLVATRWRLCIMRSGGGDMDLVTEFPRLREAVHGGG
jgi:formylmethanofuran dehydrogenase subunit D